MKQTNETIRVKIIKSSSNIYWYAANIGSTYSVVNHPHYGGAYAVENIDGPLIMKSDCEVIPPSLVESPVIELQQTAIDLASKTPHIKPFTSNVESKGEQQPTQDRETDHIVEANKLFAAPTISGGAVEIAQDWVERLIPTLSTETKRDCKRILASDIEQYAREVAGEFAEWSRTVADFDIEDKSWTPISTEIEDKRYTTSELYSLYLTFKNKKA